MHLHKSLVKYSGPFGKRWSAATLGLGVLMTFGVSVLPTTSAMAACSSSAAAGVDWSGCRKRALIVTGSDFSGANFERTDFTGSDLRNTNLTGINMNKATLNRASISGATVLNATLSGVEGIRLGAQKTTFQAVDLQKSMFFRAEFQEATLSDVNFSKAEFSRADFTGATLVNTTMESSNLSRAIFLGARFQGVNLADSWTYLTNFIGVDLTDTVGLTQVQLDRACGDASTRLPAGLAMPASWPCALDDG